MKRKIFFEILIVVFMLLLLQNKCSAIVLGNDSIPEKVGIFDEVSTNFEKENKEKYSDIIVVNDGYIVVGEATLNLSKSENYVSQAKGNTDAIIVKYNKNLSMEWFKSFGGKLEDSFSEIYKTNDNGYLIFGNTYSVDQDLADINFSSSKATGLCVKYDMDWNVSWVKIGNNSDLLSEYKNIIVKDDLGKISDGRIVLNTENKNQEINTIITKYDNDEYAQWSKTYDRNSDKTDDELTKIIESEDGYILIGKTKESKSLNGKIVYKESAIIIKYQKPYADILLDGETSYELKTGEKIDIFIYYIPYMDLSDEEIIWKSQNENIAKVDESGTVTAVNPGKTKINIKIRKKEINVDIEVITIQGGIKYRVLSESERTLEAYKFDDSIKKVIIPSSMKINGKVYKVTIIGENTFSNCNNLTDIEIPSSVIEIKELNGITTFNKSKNLKNITVNSNNTKYSSENGILFNKNKTILIKCPEGKQDKNYVVPNSVTTIKENAFQYCKTLENVTISNSVNNIGENTFLDCSKLTKASIPDSVKIIGEMAFSGCSGLTIYGYRDSYAHTYADNNNIKFETIDKYYTVDFKDFDGKILKTQVVNEGESATEPDSPTRKGYVFIGWDKVFENVTEDLEIIAQYEEIKIVEKELPFVDIKENAFYMNALKYMYTRAYVTGTTKTTFSPNDKLSRAMLVTILWNMEERPKTDGENKFPDVKNGVWYTDAIIWASSNGVVNGNKDGTFSPNNNITRQEVAIMLANYAKYKGYDITSDKDLSSFKDNNKIASWAIESVRWAVENKVISGAENGTKINPLNNATRGEAITMIKNYIDNIK